jgi:hypothetical protein
MERKPARIPVKAPGAASPRLDKNDRLRTLNDLADDSSTGLAHGFLFPLLGNDQDHAEAHVEDAEHFGRIQGCGSLKDLKNWRDSPGAPPDVGLGALRDYTREIVRQPASRDMRGAEDQTWRERGEKRLIVRVDPQEFLAQRPAKLRQP